MLWAPSPTDVRWTRTRYVLLAGWLLVLVATVALGARSASWGKVTAQVASGEVGSIRVTGALPTHARGYGTVKIDWRRGLLHYQTRVVQVHGRVGASRESLESADDASAIVRTDPGRQLRSVNPRLHVVRADQDQLSSSVWGWRVPGGVALAWLALFVLSFCVLLLGPQPWRATRWAWFWLFFPPFGPIVFLLASGPTRPLPPPASDRRLTGGWAFLLAIVLAGILKSSRW